VCSLYRANRLTALVRTVPAIVNALGERLGQTVTEFWTGTPRLDMQWSTVAIAFCDFVAQKYSDDPALAAVSSAARDAAVTYYDARVRYVHVGCGANGVRLSCPHNGDGLMSQEVTSPATPTRYRVGR
jgi:hypothetical protein